MPPEIQRQPSHPPSEPTTANRAGVGAATSDRPVRLQLFVALLVGLVLVATGLYLWRRPSARAEADEAAAASASASASAAAQASAAPPADAGPPNGVALSDPHIVACHDRGSKKTPADECDHPSQVEQALARAIADASDCVPTSAGGGTIEYDATVSFAKKRNPVTVKVPKGSGSLKNAKAVAACGKAVKQGVSGLDLDGVPHEHASYTIAITATYPGAVKSASR